METFERVTANSQLSRLGVFIRDVPDGNFDERLVEPRKASGVILILLAKNGSDGRFSGR